MPALWLVPPGPGSVLVGWGARKRVGEQEHVPASKVGWGGCWGGALGPPGRSGTEALSEALEGNWCF